MENGWKWPIYRWFTYLDCPIPRPSWGHRSFKIAPGCPGGFWCRMLMDWCCGKSGRNRWCQPWSTNRIDHCHDHRLAVTFRLLPPSSPGNGVSFKCSRADDNENGWEAVCSLLALEAKAKIRRHEVPAIQESRLLGSPGRPPKEKPFLWRYWSHSFPCFRSKWGPSRLPP